MIIAISCNTLLLVINISELPQLIQITGLLVAIGLWHSHVMMDLGIMNLGIQELNINQSPNPSIPKFSGNCLCLH
jgi:hypothetical protein